MIEFAFVAPILAFTIVAGVELANYAAVRMQLSQIAISVSDNASRLGQTDNSAVAPTISESQINSILFGALQEGKEIDLKGRGRILVSSLEYRPYYRTSQIHWQRCAGSGNYKSRYGTRWWRGVFGKKDARMGGYYSPIILAEVYLKYEPLFAKSLIEPIEMRQAAVHVVRDRRNLGHWSTDGLSKDDTPSTCD